MSGREDALARLRALPRTELATLPTPLRSAPRLRSAVAPGAPTLLIKQDDLTGFGLGGNKVRKLEHELAPDRLEGVTHLVTMGGVQSNHCRVTAAAAARLGLDCVLVVSGEPGDPPRGNALLHRLLGADVRTVPDRDAREQAVGRVAREIAAAGGRPLVVPLGASTPRGALGYARAAVELSGQLEGRTDGEVTVYLASSSAGTLAGLAAGFTLLDRGDVRLVGISADVPRDELLDRARSLARDALELLGVRSAVPPELVNVSDREVGEGYGLPTEASREATSLFARTEAVVLDPVYTAKAAAGMVRAIRQGRTSAGETLVFLHTGGHPALLA